MANTYTQIHIHAVFSVQNRSCIIQRSWGKDLYKYITGIIKNNNHKLIVINGMPDHIHLLFGLRPAQSVSDLLQDIKGGSSKWINERKLVKGRFSWQEGYGAFSYAKSGLPHVINYINNQENHHRKMTFVEEYIALLQQFGIDYNDNYIFKPVDTNYFVPDGT
ncbi:MAG: IS200/IS605 family transposase [Bacteroidales bacterium]|nr:IS200/IS605 family transposase [Bacteroidales bacterium]